jgi:RecA-family ATPase
MAIDLLAAFENEPPALDFIWPGFLAGTVGALVAPGATGKSFWALEAAMTVACSVPGGDVIALMPQHTGAVLYLAGEDPAPALVRRVHAIGKYLSDDARVAIAERLTLEPIMGLGFDVMKHTQFERLVEQCRGHRLIVLDTLSRIHQLDENSNSDMSRLTTTLERLAAQTGASVLYLHHVSKLSARDGLADQQQAARGASALIDNARWCGYVAKMTEDEAERLSDSSFGRAPIGADRRGYFVRFGVSKQNYCAMDTEKWLQRDDGGVLRPVTLLKADTQSIKVRQTRRSASGF